MTTKELYDWIIANWGSKLKNYSGLDEDKAGIRPAVDALYIASDTSNIYKWVAESDSPTWLPMSASGNSGFSHSEPLHMWAVDIKPVQAEKKVWVTKASAHVADRSIISFSTDDTDILMTLEWDRGRDYFKMPTVVDGVLVDSPDTDTASPILQAVFQVSLGNKDKVEIALGEQKGHILCEKKPVPLVSSVTLGAIPVGQTEIKAGDSIDVTVDSPTAISAIMGATNLQGSVNVTSTEITTAQPIVWRATGTLVWDHDVSVAELVHAGITIENEVGSVSEEAMSANQVNSNSIKPSISAPTCTYPIGQEAIKSGETASINMAIAGYVADEFTVNYTTPRSQLVLSDATQYAEDKVVTYTAGDYNITHANYRLSVVRVANGATSSKDYCVQIANVAPALIDDGPHQLMGLSAVKALPLKFTQKVKIKTATVQPNTGTLGTNITTDTFATTANNIEITTVAGTTLSTDLKHIQIQIVGLAGILADIQVPYVVSGFPSRTLTYVYKELSQPIGCKVVNTDKLFVSGVINTGVPFEICKYYIADHTKMTQGSEYSLSVDKLNLILPKQVVEFGYATGVDITVEINEGV